MIFNLEGKEYSLEENDGIEAELCSRSDALAKGLLYEGDPASITSVLLIRAGNENGIKSVTLNGKELICIVPDHIYGIQSSKGGALNILPCEKRTVRLFDPITHQTQEIKASVGKNVTLFNALPSARYQQTGVSVYALQTEDLLNESALEKLDLFLEYQEELNTCVIKFIMPPYDIKLSHNYRLAEKCKLCVDMGEVPLFLLESKEATSFVQNGEHFITLPFEEYYCEIGDTINVRLCLTNDLSPKIVLLNDGKTEVYAPSLTARKKTTDGESYYEYFFGDLLLGKEVKMRFTITGSLFPHAFNARPRTVAFGSSTLVTKKKKNR